MSRSMTADVDSYEVGDIYSKLAIFKDSALMIKAQSDNFAQYLDNMRSTQALNILRRGKKQLQAENIYPDSFIDKQIVGMHKISAWQSASSGQELFAADDVTTFTHDWQSCSVDKKQKFITQLQGFERQLASHRHYLEDRIVVAIYRLFEFDDRIEKDRFSIVEAQAADYVKTILQGTEVVHNPEITAAEHAIIKEKVDQIMKPHLKMLAEARQRDQIEQQRLKEEMAIAAQQEVSKVSPPEMAAKETAGAELAMTAATTEPQAPTKAVKKVAKWRQKATFKASNSDLKEIKEAVVKLFTDFEAGAIDEEAMIKIIFDTLSLHNENSEAAGKSMELIIKERAELLKFVEEKNKATRFARKSRIKSGKLQESFADIKSIYSLVGDNAMAIVDNLQTSFESLVAKYQGNAVVVTAIEKALATVIDKDLVQSSKKIRPDGGLITGKMNKGGENLKAILAHGDLEKLQFLMAHCADHRSLYKIVKASLYFGNTDTIGMVYGMAMNQVARIDGEAIATEMKKSVQRKLLTQDNIKKRFAIYSTGDHRFSIYDYEQEFKKFMQRVNGAQEQAEIDIDHEVATLKEITGGKIALRSEDGSSMELPGDMLLYDIFSSGLVHDAVESMIKPGQKLESDVRSQELGLMSMENMHFVLENSYFNVSDLKNSCHYKLCKAVIYNQSMSSYQKAATILEIMQQVALDYGQSHANSLFGEVRGKVQLADIERKVTDVAAIRDLLGSSYQGFNKRISQSKDLYRNIEHLALLRNVSLHGVVDERELPKSYLTDDSQELVIVTDAPQAVNFGDNIIAIDLDAVIANPQALIEIVDNPEQESALSNLISSAVQQQESLLPGLMQKVMLELQAEYENLQDLKLAHGVEIETDSEIIFNEGVGGVLSIAKERGEPSSFAIDGDHVTFDIHDIDSIAQNCEMNVVDIFEACRVAKDKMIVEQENFAIQQPKATNKGFWTKTKAWFKKVGSKMASIFAGKAKKDGYRKLTNDIEQEAAPVSPVGPEIATSVTTSEPTVDLDAPADVMTDVATAQDDGDLIANFSDHPSIHPHSDHQKLSLKGANHDHTDDHLDSR